MLGKVAMVILALAIFFWVVFRIPGKKPPLETEQFNNHAHFWMYID
jgi:hypothetical protein